MGAQPVVIAHIGSGFPQKIRMGIHCFQNTGENKQKLPVFVGAFSGIQQVLSLIRRQRPVVVFAGAVDTGKRLFVEQTDHTLLAGHSL